ncbi:MAG: hypothetical protein IJ526_05100 [Lachnospiraceae bacterium]|nr:hypothetical protein [Lachnospiraceae bacterium]
MEQNDTYEKNLPASAAQSTELTELAEKIYNIDNVENFNKNITNNNTISFTDDQIKMILQQRMREKPYSLQEQNQDAILQSPDLPSYVRRDRFGIIILSPEYFDDGRYQIDHNRRFPENLTSHDIREELKSLDDEAIDKIMSYPTILAAESRYNGYRAAPGQYAYYGFIRKITKYERYDEIDFIPVNKKIPQKFFDEHLYELGLEGRPRCSEMNMTHWTVKQGDIITLLKNGGIHVNYPAN